MRYLAGIFTVCLLLIITGCGTRLWSVPVHENPAALAEHVRRPAQEYNQDHYPVTVETINSLGEMQKQTFDRPPERVIAVWQNSIETLLALGVGDRIIAGNGVPGAKYFRPEYQAAYHQIPYTGLQLLDLETTMLLEPDMIVGWNSTFGSKVLRSTEFWQKRGTHTFIAANSVGGRQGRTLENELNDIRILGKIFDKNERAEAIVAEMQREIERAKTAAATVKRKPRVLVIEFMGKEASVYNRRSLAGNMVEKLQGELLVPDNVTIGLEQIIDIDPDAIFVVVVESHYGHEAQMIERVTKHPALQHLRCARAGHVYALPLYAIYSSGVRTYEGLRIISGGMYSQANGE